MKKRLAGETSLVFVIPFNHWNFWKNIKVFFSQIFSEMTLRFRVQCDKQTIGLSRIVGNT